MRVVAEMRRRATERLHHPTSQIAPRHPSVLRGPWCKLYRDVECIGRVSIYRDRMHLRLCTVPNRDCGFQRHPTTVFDTTGVFPFPTVDEFMDNLQGQFPQGHTPPPSSSGPSGREAPSSPTFPQYHRKRWHLWRMPDDHLTASDGGASVRALLSLVAIRTCDQQEVKHSISSLHTPRSKPFNKMPLKRKAT